MYRVSCKNGNIVIQVIYMSFLDLVEKNSMYIFFVSFSPLLNLARLIVTYFFFYKNCQEIAGNL